MKTQIRFASICKKSKPPTNTTTTNLLHIQWEQHIQKEDLVSPDNSLLLGLLGEPLGPLVRDVGNLEA